METSDINRNDDSVKIIAEAGINHNGDLDLAMRLVDAAKAAGADVVKFQTGNASAKLAGIPLAVGRTVCRATEDYVGNIHNFTGNHLYFEVRLAE